MTAPTPNLPLLRKAVEWAEAEAAKPLTESAWDQSVYRMSGSELDRTCGTAFCIAGYVAEITGAQWAGAGQSSWLVADDDDPPEHVSPMYGLVFIEHRVSRLLGVTEREGEYLFDPDRTIDDLRIAAEEIAARAGERL